MNRGKSSPTKLGYSEFVPGLRPTQKAYVKTSAAEKLALRVVWKSRAEQSRSIEGTIGNEKWSLPCKQWAPYAVIPVKAVPRFHDIT